MKTRKNRLFTNSEQTARRLAKQAIKCGDRIEEERMFPIYVVVSNPDKNDDILIIHPAYLITPFQNSCDGNNRPQSDKPPLPIDKPIRPIKGANGREKNSEDKESDKQYRLQ